MNRRAYLSGGAVLVASFAGCTSGTDEPSGNDSEKAREHMENAASALELADAEITSESEKFTSSDFQSGGVDIEPSTINGHLDTASAELDDAEEDATDDQQETIDAVRGYIGFARKCVSFFDVFAEGYSEAYSGFTYFESERYEDAVDEFNTAEASLSEANDLLTVTQSRFEELNTGILSEREEVELSSLEASLDKLKQLVLAMQVLVKGLRLISQGMTDFTAATSSMENEAYSDAETNFRAAAEDFNSAHSAFRAEEDSAPTEVKSSFIEMTCYSGALRDASNHLANTMEAIQNNNRDRAETKYEEAQNALDRCNFSSS